MKKYAFLVMSILLVFVLIVGCSKEDNNSTNTIANTNTQEESIDYSKYPFVNISWTRDAENDIETIRFGADGSFTYYCACGNPVNDSDLCEGYTYDDATKIITLDCLEETDEMVTVIKIVKCDENELQLDFDGDIRIFTKENA